MQRWWYLDSKAKASPETATPTTALSSRGSPLSAASASGSDETVKEVERAWTFAVHVAQPLLSAFEAVALTGDCAALGDWEPQRGVILTRQQDDGECLFVYNSTAPFNCAELDSYQLYVRFKNDVHAKKYQLLPNI